MKGLYGDIRTSLKSFKVTSRKFFRISKDMASMSDSHGWGWRKAKPEGVFNFWTDTCIRTYRMTEWDSTFTSTVGEQISRSFYLQKGWNFCHLFPSCWEEDGSHVHGLHISQWKTTGDKKVLALKVIFSQSLASLCYNNTSSKAIWLFHCLW